MNIAYANNDLNASLNADFYGTSITCSAQGELSLEYMDIEEKCVIQSDDLSYMFPGEDTLTIHSDFQLDTRGEKNNISLAIDADTGNTEIMNLSIKNTGTRQSITPASIPAPSKTIPYMEAFPDTFSYDSFDDSGDSYDYDPSYITDPETGESLVCHEYEYNEEEDYDYCLKYVLDTYDYDDYYIIDENGEELYCEEYEYNEEENYDSCVNYIAE